MGDYAFEGCESLTEIEIPSSITAISDGAFYNCIRLTNVALPATTKTIGYDAFYGCNSLKEVVLPATSCPKATGAFTTEQMAEVSVLVPEESLLAYQVDTYWSQFDLLDAIPEVDGGVPSVDAETAIGNLKGDAKIVSVYNLGGQQTPRMQKGINIIRMNDGTTRKVLVK